MMQFHVSIFCALSFFFYRFSSCRSFAPSHISPHSQCSSQRKQKNTSHLVYTKKKSLCMLWSFVSKATSCYIFHAMHTSLLCACSYVVLSIFFFISLIAIAESISNQFQLTTHFHIIPPIRSHSHNVDHKKAVFTFNFFFHPTSFYMCINPSWLRKKLFLPLHFSNWQSSK